MTPEDWPDARLDSLDKKVDEIREDLKHAEERDRQERRARLITACSVGLFVIAAIQLLDRLL